MTEEMLFDECSRHTLQFLFVF